MRTEWVPLFALVLALIGSGCAGSQLKEMQRQVDQQQSQIERQQRELEELRAQQQQQAAGMTLPPPGSCDAAVMQQALHFGDAQYNAAKYESAMGYYQDAAKACPHNTQVELSLARVYEALGKRDQARRHYQAALNAAQAGSTAASQAREGIARTGAQ
jgi:tetratricopeptide (TPR) repeat protein